MAYGVHYSDTVAGRVFSQSGTPLGLAIPIYNSATSICTTAVCAMPIWNPPNSNRNVEIIDLNIEWASGLGVISTIGIMAVPLQAVAGGSTCTAFASVTPMNGNPLSGNQSKTLSNNGIGTTTVGVGVVTAPTQNSTVPGWVRGVASINIEASTGTPLPTTTVALDFKGTMVIPPGVMIYLAGTQASGALYCVTWVWKEIPINPQGG